MGIDMNKKKTKQNMDSDINWLIPWIWNLIISGDFQKLNRCIYSYQIG